jgi:hypothetical protein
MNSENDNASIVLESDFSDSDMSVDLPKKIEIKNISDDEISIESDDISKNNDYTNQFMKDIDIKNNINITFVGEINAGKSSLINSLIGDDLLSVGIRRTTLSNTSVIRTSVLETNCEHNNYLYLSKSNRLDVFFKDNKVSLIDTIGLNDPCKDKEQYEWFNKNLDKSDIVFFVTSYEKCFSTESEQNAFKKIYSQINEMNKKDHNVCLGIIITKIDTKNSDKEYKKQIEEINNFLTSLNLAKKIPIVHIWNKELLLSRQIMELNKNINSIQKLGVMNKKDLKSLRWFSKYGGEELKKVINKFITNGWKSIDHAKECKSKYLMNIFFDKYRNKDEDYEIPVNDFLNLLKDIKTSYLKPYLQKICLVYGKFNFNEIIENNNILKKIHNFSYYSNDFSSVENHIFETFVNNNFYDYDLEINIKNVEKYLVEKLKQDYKESYVRTNGGYKLCKDLNINDKLCCILNYDYNSVNTKIHFYIKLQKRTDQTSTYFADLADSNRRIKNSNYIRTYSDSESDIDTNNTYKIDYKIDKTIALSSDYNLEDIEKYEELFKKIYKHELLKDKNSILRKYLQFKLEKLINMKVYYDQLYNLNVEKYDELREIFGLIFKNPPKLGEEDDVLKLEENKLNFTGLEKFIVNKLEEYNLSVSNSNKNRKSNKRLDIGKMNVNKDDIIVLLDRENVTNKESNYLISNYNVRSYRTNNYKLRNRVRSEKDIVVKNLGKNTVDFTIVKDAQKYLSETDKFVVIYTHDHYGEVIDKNDRYLNTGDYKMIELYYNIKLNEENKLCN